MSSIIADKSYWALSERAYKDNQKDGLPVKITYKDRTENWEIEDVKSNPFTGFDAVVYKKGDDIIISYRGTEGSNIFGDGALDVKADLDFIVMQQYVNQPSNNQFKESVELVKEVKSKNPEAKVSLTGHSLGGALASYAAAMEDVEAVTYSAPSVVGLLPKAVRKRVEEGEFDSKIFNYMHPQDSIAAGSLQEYERHIGSTYYIGSTYGYENAQDIGSPLKRFLEAVEKYHGLDNYKFDNYGNLSVDVLRDAGGDKEVLQSPRMVGSSKTIRVTPGMLISFADVLNAVRTLGEEKHLKVTSRLLSFSHIPEAQSVEPVTELACSLYQRFYAGDTGELEHHIRNTAKTMREADRLHE